MRSTKVKAIKKACIEAAKLQHELGALGLYKTMHLMDNVTKSIGFEAAEVLEASPRFSCNVSDSMAQECLEIQRKRDKASAKKKKK